MRRLRNAGWPMLTVALFAGSVACAQDQTSATPAIPKKSAARKTAKGRTRVIPLETAPATAPTAAGAAQEARQKAADHALLQQQQAQSAAAAKATDQQVQQAQKQIDRQQNEVRIQDAPGPAQTGVVPGAGVPVAPVNVNDRIQDAPGPAQTLPPLPVTQPAPGGSQTPISAPTQTPAQPPVPPLG